MPRNGNATQWDCGTSLSPSEHQFLNILLITSLGENALNHLCLFMVYFRRFPAGFTIFLKGLFFFSQINSYILSICNISNSALCFPVQFSLEQLKMCVEIKHTAAWILLRKIQYFPFQKNYTLLVRQQDKTCSPTKVHCFSELWKSKGSCFNKYGLKPFYTCETFIEMA